MKLFECGSFIVLIHLCPSLKKHCTQIGLFQNSLLQDQVSNCMCAESISSPTCRLRTNSFLVGVNQDWNNITHALVYYHYFLE
jgi:hypothetical protein